MIVGDRDRRNLLSRFFASATGEAAWSGTLEYAAALFGSGGSLLGVHDASLRVLAMDSHSYSPAFMASYFPGEIYANDPRIPHIARVPAGSVFGDRTLYDVREMHRDPWVREAIDTLKFDDEIGLKLRLPGDNVATVAFLRNQRDGGHGEEAIEALRRLAPQVEQAFVLGYFLEREAATRIALLETMALKADGVILLSASGEVSFMNDGAARVVAAGDGLTWAGGAFIAHRPPETRGLRHLIGDVLRLDGEPNSRTGGQMLVTRRSGRRPYVVRVMPPPPIECFFVARSIACIVLVQDLALDTVSAETLTELFGLSHREAELASALVRCGNLRSAAADAAMAANTARNHLQSIFLKTNVNSQPALTGLLSRLA
jgi:DNA-binding NarL/FixJ family response regulator